MLMAVPTIYHRLMDEWATMKPDLSSMRLFICGSAPLPKNLFKRFEASTGFRLLERYGMTEAQMITSNSMDSIGRVPESAGYPLPGVRVRVVSQGGEDLEPGDVGEVWVNGDNVFKGYWQMPEKTAEDTNCNSSEDSTTMMIGSYDYLFLAKSFDEQYRYDHTPDTVSFVGNFPPKIDKISIAYDSIAWSPQLDLADLKGDTAYIAIGQPLTARPGL